MPFVDVNGTTLYYESVGQGIPIVCIHPILLTGEIFSYQRASLSDRYQIITFDIRGHGKSRFSEEPLSYTMIAEDIRQLLDSLGIGQAYLCGYSVGGQIVLQALLSDPDRYLGAILIGSTSELTDPIQRGLVWIAHLLCGLHGKRLLSALDAGGNATNFHNFKSMYDSCNSGNVLNIAQYHEQVLSFNCTDRLHEIQAPILLLFGQRDTRFHQYARVMQTRLPHSTLHFIRGAPHQIPTKHAADVDGLLRLWIENQQNQLAREQHKHKHKDQELEEQQSLQAQNTLFEQQDPLEQPSQQEHQ